MSNKLSHVAFIMDGNNRWSIKNNTSKFEAYKNGANKLLNLSNYIFDNYKCNHISAFALSTSNLNRPKNIINILKKVLSFFLDQIENLDRSKYNIKFIGDLSFLDNYLKSKIKDIQSINLSSNKFLYIYLNYSGQQEIIESINKIRVSDIKIDISNFNRFLLTNKIPNPDILIRTGGFSRISDFMLFQIAFTELRFINKLWPDINSTDIKKIIRKYYEIDRKFGV